MIHSAVVKLTLWYISIIMSISVGFSVALYTLSSQELTRGFRSQGQLMELYGPPESFEKLRLQQVRKSLQHLRANLVLLNVATLVVGGGAAYILARRTLQPIAEAMATQSRFAADASHELRTPLTAMQTENEVALRNSSLTRDQAKELLRSNLEEVAKLRSLSEGLLRLAQTNGASDFPTRPVALQKIITAAVGRMSKAADQKQITIKAVKTNLAAQGDAESLTELVCILLDNAIKYSHANGAVTITTTLSQRMATIGVIDDGIGIAEKDLPHIFERFYRSDASRTRSAAGGYGLGLSIAAKIAELHRGRIEASSKAGKGTTFTVYLPLAKNK